MEQKCFLSLSHTQNGQTALTVAEGAAQQEIVDILKAYEKSTPDLLWARTLYCCQSQASRFRQSSAHQHNSWNNSVQDLLGGNKERKWKDIRVLTIHAEVSFFHTPANMPLLWICCINSSVDTRSHLLGWMTKARAKYSREQGQGLRI